MKCGKSQNENDGSKFRIALRAAMRGRNFAPEAFIESWFRNEGSSYFFLFRKNLGVTNIQMAELFALIRSHLTPFGKERPHYRFLSIPEFSESLKRLLDTFTHPSVKDPVSSVAGLYAEEFQRTIVIDPYYGSCAVYVPPAVSLNLKQICAESGYIHSCGMTVFIEKVYNTQASALIKALRRYLSHSYVGNRLAFTVYAREDWPDKSERIPALSSRGIQEVKIPVGKFFMGQLSIQKVIAKLEDLYGKKLKIARPGHIHEDNQTDRGGDNSIERDRSLFLVVDRQIGDNPKFPSDTKYFICYEQQVLNCNPCHVFDEDKPAWIDHTTIPHTLMGAMINITRPWWPSDSSSRIKLCDPFCGSGTTWLEALKYQQIIPICSDRHPMASRLANENLRFFAKTREELIVLKKGLNQLTVSSPMLRSNGYFEKAKTFFLQCATDFDADGRTILSDAARIRKFHKSDELFRYAFYLILKVERRSSGLTIDENQWGALFRQEVEKLIRAIDYWLDKDEMGEYDYSQSRIAFGQASYSCASSVNFRFIQSTINDCTVLSGREVNKLQRNSVDVIVTDPPYGFNSEEDPMNMAQLYAKMIPTLVNALRDEGQLVLALPDWSHSGRQILAFTYKEFVTHQVLLAADRRGWEVIRSAAPATRERDLFRAPFYWESDKALRRAILHFRFRDKFRKAERDKRKSARPESHELRHV